jgi:hypothetical protein
MSKKYLPDSVLPASLSKMKGGEHLKNTDLQSWIDRLEALQKGNLTPDSCTHDSDEQGNVQKFDYASSDMTLDQVIGERKQGLIEGN